MFEEKYYNKFPSPLEVDRFLYYKKDNNVLKLSQFPSPLEVDRFLYRNLVLQVLPSISLFPSPLEVDRFLYEKNFCKDIPK